MNPKIENVLEKLTELVALARTKYTKPTNGIPASDLSSLVNQSLNKANSAVQDSGYVHTDNNFSTPEKTKLAGLSNYDDTEVKSDIADLEQNKAEKTEIPDVSQFITRAVNDLTNYYLKSETYTKAEVNNLIGQIQTVRIEVVQTLPTTGESNVIYFVPKAEAKIQDVYNEYIYTNNAWELIGSTQVDLTGYATETWVNNGFVEKVTGKGLSTNDYTTAEKTKLSGLSNYDDTAVRNLIEGKQNTISDLTQIRKGSEKGFTSVQYDSKTENLKTTEITDFPFTGKVVETGELNDNTSYSTTDFISLADVRQIYRDHNETLFSLVSYAFYNKNKQFIQYVPTITPEVDEYGHVQYVLNSDAYYIRISKNNNYSVLTYHIVTVDRTDYTLNGILDALNIPFKVDLRTEINLNSLESGVYWCPNLMEVNNGGDKTLGIYDRAIIIASPTAPSFLILHAEGSYYISNNIDNWEEAYALSFEEVKKLFASKTATSVDNPLNVNTIYDLGVKSSLILNLPSGQLGDWIEVQFICDSTPTTLTITSSTGMTDYDFSPTPSHIYGLYFSWQKIDTNSYGWTVNINDYEKRTV